MQPTKLKQFELKLFYSLLRSAIKFDKIIKHKHGDIEREIKRLGHCYPSGIIRKYDSMVNGIRISFRQSNDETFDTDKVFYAMKNINNRLEIISNPKWKPNNHIKYDIGQICRHKKWEFRLVIVATFNKCPCDQNWIEMYGPFEHGIQQPFYKTMICIKDRDPFMSIAAQENLIPIDATKDGGAVEHPLINSVFSGYDDEGGRMIPHAD
eukprot:106285_1